MQTLTELNTWLRDRIKQNEINKYLSDGKDFINEKQIETKIAGNKTADRKKIEDILAKSMNVETLTLDETAYLLNVTDPEIYELMKETAIKIKKKVYDNRIVTFAPLYMGNYCVNECLYCGFRCENREAKRRVLSFEEIEDEIRVLAGKIGHKRLIVVAGEHPKTDIDYITEAIRRIYSVKEKTRKGESRGQTPTHGQIRRVNVNAPPFEVEDLKKLKEVGIGTYQVFQETYHRATYEKIHPQNTLKGNYRWRLYCMHRALEAGIDDVGLGALFGLYDWRFEVMSLVAHNRDLEARYGVGGHTISFPRLEPASNAPLVENSKWKVSDEELKKIIVVLRLSVPHTGMIITAREGTQMRRDSIPLGITQTDASTKIGIGGYSDKNESQEGERQQFMLGDTRSLDEVIREFAEMGYITSFCTAGYRCGRTGECIMDLLKTGAEGKFCKLNAVLTFREWLDDFASEETKMAGEKVIQTEIEEVRQAIPTVFPSLMDYYERIKKGERDLYF